MNNTVETETETETEVEDGILNGISFFSSFIYLFFSITLNISDQFCIHCFLRFVFDYQITSVLNRHWFTSIFHSDIYDLFACSLDSLIFEALLIWPADHPTDGLFSFCLFCLRSFLYIFHHTYSFSSGFQIFVEFIFFTATQLRRTQFLIHHIELLCVYVCAVGAHIRIY